MNAITTRLTIVSAVMIVLLPLFVGCDVSDNAEHTDNEDLENISIDTVEQDEYAWIAQYIPLPNHIGEISNLAFFGDKVYFVASLTDSGNADNLYITTNTVGIYSVDLDGASLTVLADYTPPAKKRDGTGGMAWINCLTIDNWGDIWVSESWNYYEYDNFPMSFNTGEATGEDYAEYVSSYSSGNTIRKLDRLTGVELHRIDLVGIFKQQDSIHINSIAIDGCVTDSNATIYIDCTAYSNGIAAIYALDSTGDVLFKRDYTGYFAEFVHMLDGTVAFSVAIEDYQESWKWVRELQMLSTGKTDMTETPNLTYFYWEPRFGRNSTKLIAGSDEFDLYINNDISLFGFRKGESEIVELFNWILCDIDENALESIIALPDGRILCLSTTWNPLDGSQKNAELVVIGKLPLSEVPTKTVITLAAQKTYLDQKIRNAVVEFNRNSTDYIIKIKEYNSYEQLNIEIIAGNVPDILALDGLPYEDYALNGLLVDIYELIDADPEIDRSDFMQPVFAASEINGNLYGLYPCFAVGSISSHPSITAQGMGWDFEEFEAVLAAHPEADIPLSSAGGTLNKTDVLEILILSHIDELVNYQAGTVHFDSPLFIKLLESTSRFPDASEQYTGFSGEVYAKKNREIADGRQIAEFVIINDFNSYLMSKSVWGGDLVFKGTPCKDKNGHILFEQAALAITEKSPNKDASWEFTRMLLDSSWQLSNTQADYTNTFISHFPTNKVAFSYVMEKAPGTEFNIYGKTMRITQEDVDKVAALINALPVGKTIFEEVLYNIVFEEVANYFHGVKSADDVARIIQSRAAIYVAERS